MKRGDFSVKVIPSEGGTVKAEITFRPHGQVLDDVPVAECSGCGRRVPCIRVSDGTVYRPLAWLYEKPGDLVGICGSCQETGHG